MWNLQLTIYFFFFILRETGLVDNDTPRIHTDIPTEDTHTIQHEKSRMVIELKLDGKFSIFKSRESTNDNLVDRILVVITREGKTWDYHYDLYANNESAYFDYNVNIFPSEYVHKKMVKELDYTGLDYDY